MRNKGNRKADDSIQDFLDAETSQRLERLVKANNFLSAWHEKHLGPALELANSKPWIKKHAEATRRLGELIEKGAERERNGALAGREHWAKEVMPLWNKIFSDKTVDRIHDFHARNAVTGYEREYVAGLLGLDNARKFDFIQRHGKDRAVDFWQDESTPEQGDSDVGVVRQGLEAFTRCTPAPYPMGGVSKADSGPAINVSSGGVAFSDGSGFLSVMTLALVAMGGGSAATGVVGIESPFPAGFSKFSASATIDVSFSGRSFTFLGGATASINLKITAILPDGRQFSAVRLIDAIPSPLMWYRDVNTLLRNQVIDLPAIDLQGIAGPVRVFAGVQVFSAGVGVVGSSSARMDASFMVKQICVTLE